MRPKIHIAALLALVFSGACTSVADNTVAGRAPDFVRRINNSANHEVEITFKDKAGIDKAVDRAKATLLTQASASPEEICGTIDKGGVLFRRCFPVAEIESAKVGESRIDPGLTGAAVMLPVLCVLAIPVCAAAAY